MRRHRRDLIAAAAAHGIQNLRVFGSVAREGYGLTEGTCASTCNPLDGPRKAGTVGVALPGALPIRNAYKGRRHM